MTPGQMVVRRFRGGDHDNDLDSIRDQFAAVIDHILKMNGPVRPSSDNEDAYLEEQKRLIQKSIDCLEEGCMWAVKAATT